MQYIIALTGGIGSGKSTVASNFAKLGVPIVDTDVIAREVVKPNSATLHDIALYFGSKILNPDKSLNRAALRTRVFNNLKDKIWLDKLLHPIIEQYSERYMHSILAPYILWVVPLLIENNLHHRCNRILVVDAHPEIQIARTIRRDAINREQAESILSVQLSRQTRLTYADDIINNNGSLETIKNRIAILHKHYLNLATNTDSFNETNYCG